MSRPVRIGVVSKIPTPYRLPLYRRVAEQPGLELEILFLAADEPHLPWDVEAGLAGVPHRFLPGLAVPVPTGRGAFLYHANPEIVGMLRRGGYDLLVVGGYTTLADQAAIVYARARGIPYVVHNESHLGKPRPAWVRAVKRAALPPLLSGAAGGLAVGSAAARYLAAYGVHPARIRIFPNTVDVGSYRAAAETARRAANDIRRRRDLPERFVVFAGRLIPDKGVDDLAAALRRLGADAPQLLVCGEGPLAPRLGALAPARLLGFQARHELVELLALADALVLPSRSEPWGVVVVEALACGCPVIVSDAVGAAQDLVADGVDGRVVPAGDVGALADALAEPRPHPRRLGPVRRFDYQLGVEQFLDLVRLVLPGRLPAGG